jgi:hypothetical protein
LSMSRCARVAKATLPKTSEYIAATKVLTDFVAILSTTAE